MDNPFEAMYSKLVNIEMMIHDLKSGSNLIPEEVYFPKIKAAEFLDKTPNAIGVMVHKNQIPYIKKQGKLFFKKSDLIAWLESGHVNTQGQEDIERSLVATKKRS